MRKNVDPGSTKKDTKNTQPFVFDTFSRGTIQDPPASEITDALADSKNLTIYPRFYEGRTGCRLYTRTKFPVIEGRTGYSAHKVGSHIVSDSGAIFSQQDVGNYFCFGDNYELITEYIGTGEVVGENTTYRDGVACFLIGSPNIFDFHRSIQQWIMLLGRDIYTADIPISAWNKILVISRDLPYSSKSDYSEYKDKYVFFNGGGMFKVDPGATYPIAYRVNIDPPNIRILSVPYDDTLFHKCRYRYLYSAQRLETEGLFVDRQTPSVIDQETGTNIVDADNIDFSEVWTEYGISETWPFAVRTLWVPIVKNTNPQEYQWHFTHFPVWRTPNLESIDPFDTEKSRYNDPARFIWVKDLRICGAFYGHLLGLHFYATRGEFEAADRYSILELDDGQRFEIIQVVSSTHVRLSGGVYYGTDDAWYAAATGNGRVIRGTVTGGILTRTHGTTFTAADERKTIHNSFGYRFYVTDYIDANRVRLHIDNDQPLQGFTMDPTHRNFYDTTEDEILYARKDFYSCYSRYREALPSCNVGSVIPGFIVESFRGKKDVYYAHLQNNLDFLIGQYVKIQKSEEVQDAISFYWKFQDMLAIICASSTWGVAIGLSEFTTLPGSNEAVALLPGIKQVVKNIGSIDAGSAREIDGDLIELITNEQGGEALRQFNGTSYTAENFLLDESLGGRIIKALQKTKKLSMSIYDGLLGYILWRKNA